MSNNQQYKSISELAQSIKENIELIESGTLDNDGMSNLIDQTRDLYDRLVVIRYKAFEQEVKGGSDTKASVVEPSVEAKQVVEEKPQKVEDPKEESDLFGGGFKLDFSDQNEIKPASKPKPKQDKKANPVAGKQEAIPVPDQPLPFNNPNPPKKVEPKVEPKVEEEEVKAAENQIDLIEIIDDTPKSLNETLAEQKSGDNLASKLAQQPISDLKSAIGINQKFLFMNDLFAGEHDAYHSLIDKINGMSSEAEALEYIQQEVVGKYAWDMESVSVGRFLNLVSRRFF